jgi:hypothetical protein
MIKDHITSGHSKKEHMTHRMLERNPTGQDKIKLGHIGYKNTSQVDMKL